jgi:hypothetical protein
MTGELDIEHARHRRHPRPRRVVIGRESPWVRTIPLPRGLAPTEGLLPRWFHRPETCTVEPHDGTDGRPGPGQTPETSPLGDSTTSAGGPRPRPCPGRDARHPGRSARPPRPRSARRADQGRIPGDAGAVAHAVPGETPVRPARGHLHAEPRRSHSRRHAETGRPGPVPPRGARQIRAEQVGAAGVRRRRLGPFSTPRPSSTAAPLRPTDDQDGAR